MFVSKKIINFIKKVLGFLYKITVIPLKFTVLFILEQIKKLCKFIFKTGRTAKSGVYYSNQKYKTGKNASKGFALYYRNSYKNNGNIDGKTAKSIAGIIKKDSAKNQKTLEKPNGKR